MIVVSGDRDLLQVVSDDPVPVRVLYVGRGLAKAEMMGPVEVGEKYGVPADRAGIGYAEMSMLRGDPSDGLPGVPGIGEKTAAKLISEYGSLDALEAAARDSSSKVPTRARKALLAAEDGGDPVAALDRVTRVVKVVGFVASDAAFTAQPAVVNGASHLLHDVLGPVGVHARSAVGVAVLPLDSPVEVELVVETA